MLSIKNLHASVAGKPILKGINLEIKPGEVHAIMGPNGSGKSTLAKVIAGHPGYEATAGSVVFQGEETLEMEPDEAMEEEWEGELDAALLQADDLEALVLEAAEDTPHQAALDGVGLDQDQGLLHGLPPWL